MRSAAPYIHPSRVGTMYTRRCPSTTLPRSGGEKPYTQSAKREWASRLRITHASVRRAFVVPSLLPRSDHSAGIVGLPQAAVVATQGAKVVALFPVEVVAQDDATIAQIDSQVEQVVVRPADQLDPERHHLHVAARTDLRDGVLAKTALHVDDAEHELRIQARPRRLVLHRLEQL